MTAQAAFDFVPVTRAVVARYEAASLLTTLAASCEDPDTRAHIERAAWLVGHGAASDATDYMRKRAHGGLRHARELKGRQEAWSRYERERVLARALVFLEAYRLAKRAPASTRATLDVPVLHEVPLYVGQTVAAYKREVANPHWPELSSHGVWVDVGGYQALGKRWKVELQCFPPDQWRTQHVAIRLVESRDEAMRLARRWAAIGEAVVNAQIEMNAAHAAPCDGCNGHGSRWERAGANEAALVGCPKCRERGAV